MTVVVVADTSPLNYLVLIGQIGVLRRLYGTVLVPPEVLAELAGSGAPPKVSAAVMRQLLDLPTALTRLAATNFRVSLALIERGDILEQSLDQPLHVFLQRLPLSCRQ